MQRPWTVGVFGLLVCVAADRGASAQDARRAHAPSSRDGAPSDETRWYAAEPHVPLARVANGEGGAIDSAPHAACAAWSRVGAAWSAIDRWGQVVRPSRLVSRDYYDATRCYEAAFDADDSHPESYAAWRPGRVVLYASRAFRPRASAEWSPSRTDRADHHRFLATLTPMLRLAPAAHPGRAGADGAVADALFFQFRDANGQRRFAVSGGPVLVVAERAAGGRWVTVYVDNQLANALMTNEMPYRPLAVFDMNGDGRPEVVYHDREGGGEFFGDAVLSLDGNGQWHLAARSAGGSTA